MDPFAAYGDAKAYAALMDKVGAKLAECKKIDGDRPEAYYNEAILTQEYEAKGGDSSKSVPALKQAGKVNQIKVVSFDDSEARKIPGVMKSSW
mgnify:CR=1 FL=1